MSFITKSMMVCVLQTHMCHIVKMHVRYSMLSMSLCEFLLSSSFESIVNICIVHNTHLM